MPRGKLKNPLGARYLANPLQLGLEPDSLRLEGHSTVKSEAILPSWFDEASRSLRDTILAWLDQFDESSISIREGPGDHREVLWEISIQPTDPACSKAAICWIDYIHLYFGRMVWLDRVEAGDAELIMKHLDAAASGRLEERWWEELRASRAEFRLPDGVVKVSYGGGLDYFLEMTPPDETIVYQPWPRRL